jgi:parallel beta-helix repeat protein
MLPKGRLFHKTYIQKGNNLLFCKGEGTNLRRLAAVKLYRLLTIVACFSIICALFNGLGSALEDDEASVSVSWSSQTHYPGSNETVTVFLKSNYPETLTIFNVGLHFDWMVADSFYGLDLSGDPVTILSYGNHTFEPINFLIPDNASVGTHSYYVGVDGLQGTIQPTVFSWDSQTLTLQVQDPLSSSPATEWNHTYGGTYNDDGHSVVETSDGGYAIAGAISSYGAGGYDVWLVKTDSAGIAEWNQTYGGTSEDAGWSVVETSDGGYAIAGYTISFGSGGYDLWLIKTDAYGNEQWNQSFGGTNDDVGYSVVETSDGGFAITGHTLSFGAGEADAWLVKTDAYGNEQWNQTYGGNSIEVGWSVVETSDGGFAIAGLTWSYGAGGYGDVWLVKTDSAGIAEWNQTYGGMSSDVGYSMVETSDGGFAITGYTSSYGAGYYDAWLVKTDANGNEQWNQTYGGPEADAGVSVVETSDGGFAIAGATRSYTAGMEDFWLVKTDVNGDLQWNKTYGGPYLDEGVSVVETSDGGFAITGRTQSFGAGGSDVWLIKVSASGTPSVHNVNTGISYFSIQEAIDATATLNGHTIFVEERVYYETVTIDKSITLVGESRENTIIDGNFTSDVITILADNVSLSDFTIMNSHKGWAPKGVWLHGAKYCNLTRNTICNNIFGVKIDSGSCNNTFRDNILVNNEFSLVNEFANTEQAMNDIDSSNTVNGHPIYYWINKHNAEVPQDAGFVMLVNCTEVVVRDLNLTGSGLWLVNTSDSMIVNNTFSGNLFGIGLWSSSDNNLIGNNISENLGSVILHLSSNNFVAYNRVTYNGGSRDGVGVGGHVFFRYSHNNTLLFNYIAENYWSGIKMENSSGNRIVQNSFIDHVVQVESFASTNIWDGGYPSGGNYWSDYNGTDANGDGIGDAPYIIDSNNSDNYPLMTLILEREVGVKKGDRVKFQKELHNYSSNDPNPPFNLNHLETPKWIEFTVQEIQNSKIVFSVVSTYENGQTSEITGTSDVSTGEGNQSIIFLAANLSQGDSLYLDYHSNYYITLRINETVIRNYLGVPREVNHLNYTFETTVQWNSLNYTRTMSNDLYWDRVTGALLEMNTIEMYTNNEYNYTTLLVQSYVVSATNLFGVHDDKPPTVSNVRHEPLYPIYGEEIFVYADVTDNVAVSTVWVNYTLNGGATWLLKQMALTTENTYSASLGNYSQFQLIGFTVIAYDTSGNKAVGSEDSPPTGPPIVAPIVVSDEPVQPLPNGEDIGYNITDTGTEVYANVTELGIYTGGANYNISYSLDGGITWINGAMMYVGEFVWSYVIPDTTNILFKIEGDNGESTQVYWIIVGPWEYPIYLYFSENEQYYPVAGLDFDGDSDITNNHASYDANPEKWKNDFLANDIDDDGITEVWSYAYMNPKIIEDGCLVIEYWIYYAFNNYPFLLGDTEVIADNHEHDFEAIYLWIDIATGQIKKLACAQHTWVNHYIFDVNNPPAAINIGVEDGGHGMALLKDENNDGQPDVNYFGYYSIIPGVDKMGNEEIFVPTFLNPFVINPNSIRAQLYPEFIYDPRIPSSSLHLFADTSTLTAGLAYNAIFPQFLNDADVIAEDYQWLTNLVGSPCMLKTSYAYSLPITSDIKLQFLIMSPIYRQEFQNPTKLWDKMSFGQFVLKQGLKAIVIPLVAKYLIAYFGVAGVAGLVAPTILSQVTSAVVSVMFDPVEGSVIDSAGNVLGYSNSPNNFAGGIIWATRNMTNDIYDLFMVLTNSTDYIYEVRGTNPAQNYTMSISLVDGEGNEVKFEAINIPIGVGVVHKFSVNWTALKEGKSAVQVQVDWNGDGTPDNVFWSDDELTSTEFLEGIGDSVPPVTADDYDGLWHNSDFTVTLAATDSSGISETFYRINGGSVQSVSIDGQPQITSESGTITLEYWSVDGVGNEELPHKMLTQIKLDKTAPTGSILINNGASSTTSTSVTLTLTSTDATSGVYQVRFSNDGVWDTEQWETPASTKTWTLTSGNGGKTVYYQIKDNAGLVSSTYSDTITLTSPPSDSGDSGTSSGSSSSGTTPSPTPSPSPSPSPSPAPTPTPSPSPEPTPSPTPPPEETPLFLYAIAVVVAFAAIGAVTFLLKKRR